MLNRVKLMLLLLGHNPKHSPKCNLFLVWLIIIESLFYTFHILHAPWLILHVKMYLLLGNNPNKKRLIYSSNNLLQPQYLKFMITRYLHALFAMHQTTPLVQYLNNNTTTSGTLLSTFPRDSTMLSPIILPLNVSLLLLSMHLKSGDIYYPLNHLLSTLTTLHLHIFSPSHMYLVEMHVGLTFFLSFLLLCIMLLVIRMLQIIYPECTRMMILL